MFELSAYRGRTCDYAGSMYQPDGLTAYLLASGDKLRFKVGPGPLLDLVSGANTAAGSTVAILTRGTAAVGQTPATPATYRIRLAEGDLDDLPPATYDAELLVVSATDTGPTTPTKLAELGSVHVLETLGGATGL